MLAVTLEIPGPRSRARISSPTEAARTSGPSRILPVPACLTMLVAASVTASATLPACVSPHPRAAAISTAARRASPTWVRSSIWIKTCDGTWLHSRLSSPTGDGDLRSLPYLGFDGKVVREPLRAAQSQPQPPAAGPPVLQCQLNISNSGTFVGKNQRPPPPRGLAQTGDLPPAAPAVVERVARQLAGRGDELSLVDEGKTLRYGALACGLAHTDDVLLRFDRQDGAMDDCH